MEKFIIPPSVTAVIDKIEHEGYEAWLVGGCVRDLLRGETPHDYDIASNAPCEAVCAMFERVIETGLKHGTVTVIYDGEPIEVTRYRIDGGYADHRRPDSVKFTGSFEDDLSRRDFTVNAIGYSLSRGLFDRFGGKKDIEKGILRTVGDAEKRFDEDALRIMRAVRFASTLGYSIEQSTLNAAKKLAPTLQNVSAERIYSELKKTLCGTRPSLIEIPVKNGGLKHIGLCECESLLPLDRISANPNVRLAALIHLCKAEPKAVMQALKSDKAARNAVINLCEMLENIQPLNRANLKRMLSRADKDELFALLTAYTAIFGIDTEAAKATLSDIIQKNEPYRICDLDIDGDALREMGICGKAAGKTLSFLLDMVIENPMLNTREQLKKLADRH